MSDTLIEHDGKVSTGGRNITSLWFALAEEEQELEALVESPEKLAQGLRWRPVLRRSN